MMPYSSCIIFHNDEAALHKILILYPFHEGNVNASKNILVTGLAVSAWVAIVRPKQAKSVKASAMKQKFKSRGVGILAL